MASNGYGLFLDGSGHYSLRGETRTNPGFSTRKGYHQGVRHSFGLDLEFRANDRASLFTNFRLFKEPREAFLGDDGRFGKVNNQDPVHPKYDPYVPRITEAYVRYAMDLCLLEAGRRSRNWGMGIFLSDDHAPFNYSSSNYDGISCDVNIQKYQTFVF
jgi:hypothetical protein